MPKINEVNLSDDSIERLATAIAEKLKPEAITFSQTNMEAIDGLKMAESVRRAYGV